MDTRHIAYELKNILLYFSDMCCIYHIKSLAIIKRTCEACG